MLTDFFSSFSSLEREATQVGDPFGLLPSSSPYDGPSKPPLTTLLLESAVLEDSLFYFNSVEQVLAVFAKLSTVFRKASLSHLSRRALLMHADTQRFEEAFADVVATITRKRRAFYDQYGGVAGEGAPSRERALDLLQRISHRDVLSLRRISRPTQAYEFFAAPLLVLFDTAPARQV